MLIIVVQTLFSEHLQRWGFTLQEHDIEVIEDLPNFFEAVKLYHADQIIKEFENLRDNYMIEIQRPDFVARLAAMPTPKTAISTGTPWYSILSNPLYAEDFCYIGAEIADRNKYIKD